MEKYSQQVKLPQLGAEGQEKLNRSKVLVIGAGGLGCAVLPYLAASGIGTIGIVDGDKIEESNLHRQILYRENQIGLSKAIQAEVFLKSAHSGLTTHVFDTFLNESNGKEIIGEFDLVIDATDNLAARYVINDACVSLDKPFVYGSIHRFQGQVAVFNYQTGPTYRDLFPDENQSPVNCSDAGVLGTTVGMIGMLQANEAMKIILGTGSVLSGKMLMYDMLGNEQYIFEFTEAEGEIKEHKRDSISYSFMSPSDAIMSRGTLLDVRELDEMPKLVKSNCVAIPITQLKSRTKELTKEEPVFVFCQSGVRSRQAALLLVEQGFTQVWVVQGGVRDLLNLHNHEENIY